MTVKLNKSDVLENLAVLGKDVERYNHLFMQDGFSAKDSIEQYVRLQCRYGECLRDLRFYYDENGYPFGKPKATNHDVWHLDEESIVCHAQLRQMRKMLSNIVGEDFFQTEPISDLIQEIYVRSCFGDYSIPENVAIKETKQDILAKSVGVFFSLWQQKKAGKEVVYNEEEVDYLLGSYKLYKDFNREEALYLYSISGSEDNSYATYCGPQFGFQVEKVLNSIENDYTYQSSSNYIKKLAKE